MPASVYTTRARLQEAGIQISNFSDSKIVHLIRRVSALIDTVTQQKFNPIEEVANVNGNETVLVARSDLLPIISISSITVDLRLTTNRGKIYRGGLSDIVLPRTNQFTEYLSEPSLIYVFPAGTWSLRPETLPRYIESSRGIFPGGAGNVKLDGVFGWLEPSSLKTFSSTLASDLLPQATSVTLASVSGLERRDVIQVDKKINIIVNDINTSTNTIYFDNLDDSLVSPIPSGATVKSWGAVPYAIETAANLLCAIDIARMSGWEQGSVIDPTRIRSEQTDKYRYEVFSPYQMIGIRGVSGMTGVAEVDEILMSYTAPPYVGFA
jgi:hypothetical protein